MGYGRLHRRLLWLRAPEDRSSHGQRRRRCAGEAGRPVRRGCLVRGLARGGHGAYGQPSAVGHGMDLGGHSPTGATDGVVRPPFCRRRLLVGTNDGALQQMQVLRRGLIQPLENAQPDALPGPSIVVVVDRGGALRSGRSPHRAPDKEDAAAPRRSSTRAACSAAKGPSAAIPARSDRGVPQSPQLRA